MAIGCHRYPHTFDSLAVSTTSFHSSSWSPLNPTTAPTTTTTLRRCLSSAAGKTTGQLVKELRTLSGAPIVDCKKALGETDGDLEQALDLLRRHGVAKASKKLSGREAEEGLVACSISGDGKSASIVKVSSETDFAGKSETFVSLATHIADATVDATKIPEGPIDAETVLGLEHNSKTVQLALEEAIVAIRENLGIASAHKLTTTDGLLVSYVHGKADGKSNAGSAAAVVEIVGINDSPINDTNTAAEAGKKLAMHVVASKPLYMDSTEVPDDVLQHEKSVLEGQVRLPIYSLSLV
jgi:elongation factor Ts